MEAIAVGSGTPALPQCLTNCALNVIVANG